jgi:hypothetical protein
MSRPLLSLFVLDAPALASFKAELHTALAGDDRSALVTLLDLHGDFAERARSVERAVDLFLVPESDPSRSGLYAALRRVTKKRALEHVWTSDSPALEGRLRQYDDLRADPEAAKLVDALLDQDRLPWFLRRPLATAGRLLQPEREALAQGLLMLDDPPPELCALGHALAEASGDVVCHDGLR